MHGFSRGTAHGVTQTPQMQWKMRVALCKVVQADFQSDVCIFLRLEMVGLQASNSSGTQALLLFDLSFHDVWSRDFEQHFIHK